MWSGDADNIRMTEGDYGITLPFGISGATLGNSDSFLFTFKANPNDETAVLTKTFDGITNNTIPFALTEAESALFSPGWYVYSLDWYHNGSFNGCIIEHGTFEVGDKI